MKLSIIADTKYSEFIPSSSLNQYIAIKIFKNFIIICYKELFLCNKTIIKQP